MQKIVLLICLFILLPLSVAAQGNSFVRYDCLAAGGNSSSHGLQAPRRKLSFMNDWDSTRVYPVAVVLVSFSDCDFSSEDPADRYDRIFNEPGYNEGKGPGCVADYFRDQSSGWFRPRFDIYGPVKLASGKTENGELGMDAFRNAAKKVVDSLKVDFSPYDWNADAIAESVIFIYAGYGGNEESSVAKGCIWPNTSSFSSLNAGNVTLYNYSASAEMWSNDKLCGIGTVCHEYSHTLGLPDIYPTSGSEYSVVDEWDLMDGGNFVNSGWCPPCYSPHERMLLGWMEPEELAGSTAIEQMKPLSEGGKTYIIRTSSDKEFFLLENRQWSGWDLRTPGHGLLISHVYYDAFAWSSNTVNNKPDQHRYEYVHADNMDYNDWDAVIGDENPYVSGHSRYLSTTPYPLVNDSLENRSLTDNSVPAATTYTGSGLLSKPITDISETDGLISFSFMGGIFSGISDGAVRSTVPTESYDLLGRKTLPGQNGIIIRNGKKFIHQFNKHN